MEKDIQSRRAHYRATRPNKSTLANADYFLPIVDHFLDDMAIEKYRRKNWWHELVTPYKPEDYKTVLTHRV